MLVSRGGRFRDSESKGFFVGMAFFELGAAKAAAKGSRAWASPCWGLLKWILGIGPLDRSRVEQFLEEATVWRKLFVSANGLEASLKVKKDSLVFLPSYRGLQIQRAH